MSAHAKRALVRGARSLGALLIGAVAAFLVSGDFTNMVNDTLVNHTLATLILLAVVPAAQGLDKLRRDVKGSDEQ